jgi:hypothetical protein
MYECDMIEMEDFGFNHYLHHFDESECELVFNEDYDCIKAAADCIEEIIWS